jgi:hypothetical protein
MENEFEYGQDETESSENQVTTDPSYLQPSDNVWISTDEGTTYVSDPEQGVPYDFCINIVNRGDLPSGSFMVKFVLSGDADPAEEYFTDDVENLDPGDSTFLYYHYGSFENKFAVYHLQAIVCSADGTEISTDQGFDFTINSA